MSFIEPEMLRLMSQADISPFLRAVVISKRIVSEVCAAAVDKKSCYVCTVKETDVDLIEEELKGALSCKIHILPNDEPETVQIYISWS
jgi:hypothetical protein